MKGAGGGYGFPKISEFGQSIEEAAIAENAQNVREAVGRLAANSIRRGNHFATVAVSYTDADGTEIGTSSTLIIVSGEAS